MIPKKMEKVGLVAGSGNLPGLFLEKAAAKGLVVYTLAVEGEAKAHSLRPLSAHLLALPAGRLDEGAQFFREHGVSHAVMLGRVRHTRLFSKGNHDEQMKHLLANLPDKRTATVLSAILNYFEGAGIQFLPSTFLLEDLLLPPQTRFGPTLSEAEEKDVVLGRKVAENLSLLDVGLTVAVKDGVVLAVEAVEGTDLCLRRAGRYTTGMVVVKVSRPNQDFRFDLPVVGKRTIRLLSRLSGRVLAISSHTLFLDKEAALAFAQRHAITVLVF